MHLYREFPPHPALAAHLACLWTSHARPEGSPVLHRVLPDNCIDILWQDRAPFGFVAGMMSRAHLVESVAPVRTVAVRFLPGAARAFFDLPLDALQDEHPALEDLWPRDEADRLAADLWERELDVGGQCAVIERALLARLRARDALGAADPAGRLARAAVQAIEASGGTLRIEVLAQGLGVSRQHLARSFRERVGLNAKTFGMVCRFRRTQAALRGRAGPGIDWAGLAAECGYYDQSHLIQAFHQFADQAPAEFMRGMRR